MKSGIILAHLLLPTAAVCQKINVEREIFPGIRKVIVASATSGYRGEYVLDAKGRTQVEKRYRRRQHLATSTYSFTRNGRQAVQTVAFDCNDPGKVRSIYRQYQFAKDSSRTLAELCYTDTDTLYKIVYNSFDKYNRPLSYSKRLYGRGNYLEDIVVSYQDGKVTSWTNSDRLTGIATTCAYTYNAQGDVISEKRSETPKASSVTSWIDGQGDYMRWRYAYDKEGRWTKKYKLIEGGEILVESRRYLKKAD